MKSDLTAPELDPLLKYARRMRKLWDFGDIMTISAQVVKVLQRHVSSPLLQNLGTPLLEDVVSGSGSFPHVLLFLSPGTTDINIMFSRFRPDTAVIASTLTSLSTLCPNLQNITLHLLLRDPTITAAVSGMLLASRNTLRCFRADSPLTKEACDVACTLSRLRELGVVVTKGNPLPTLALPGLAHLSIELEGDHDSDWLRVSTCGKLESVTFNLESRRAGDFVEAFGGIALAASAHTTLPKFQLHTSYPWNQNYSFFLPFTELAHLVIGFPCGTGCSSSVDDGVVTNLARTMPKLETLRLGDDPCRKILTGVTARGLMALANHCQNLSTLRVHLRMDALSGRPGVGMDSSAGPPLCLCFDDP